MANIELTVPDIGDVTDAAVIELLVKVGETIKVEQSLITIESDKASMEVPAAQGGVLKELYLKLGDKVSQGTRIGLIEVVATASATAAAPASDPAPVAASVAAPTAAPAPAAAPVMPESSAAVAPAPAPAPAAPAAAPAPEQTPAPVPSAGAAAVAPAATAHPPSASASGTSHASPSVRRFARELGVPIAQVAGSGPKGRITQDDVQGFVKQLVAQASGAAPAAASASGAGSSGGDLGGMSLLPWPKVDFAKHGPTERQPLSRIQKLSGANLHRNWVRIPHVTNHDEADITELEAWRVALNAEQAKARSADKAPTKFTLLAFLLKACAVALKQFPQFNASLDGDELVLKQYVNIGFAADTPHGLVVPVIRDVDRKSLSELALEAAALAAKAREGKLSPAEMTGGNFSISSLGGFGGTTFTPIINAPEVAILGVCRSAMKPVWNGNAFEPRLM